MNAKNITAYAVVLVLLGCGKDSVAPPEAAKGDTPIRFVICGVGDINCFVAARFKTMGGCESHKRWSGMLCDSASEPGKIVCSPDTGAIVSVAYCTL